MSALLTLRYQYPTFSGGDHRPVAGISVGRFAYLHESGRDRVSRKTTA